MTARWIYLRRDQSQRMVDRQQYDHFLLLEISSTLRIRAIRSDVKTHRFLVWVISGLLTLRPKWSGAKSYLQGATLISARYTRYSETWDHGHCEICWVKFTEDASGIPDSLHQGYCTEDQYRWIYPDCFKDFKDQFGWIVK